MKMPPFATGGVLAAPNGKHYRMLIRSVPCGTHECADSRHVDRMHVHMVTSFLDPLPITYRGMVTWPTRKRRRRRP